MAKRKRRTFTPEFKTEVVLEALRGESSQAELCRRHNLSDEQFSKWKQQLIENVASLFDACGISTTKLILTLRNFGPNERWHFNFTTTC